MCWITFLKMRDLVANVALRDGHCSRKNFLSDVVPPRCVSLRLLPFYSQSSLNVAVMPLNPLLLVSLQGWHSSIFEHWQVILEYLALWLLYIVFCQGKKHHWLWYKGHHSVIQEQCDRSEQCTFVLNNCHTRLFQSR